MNGYDFQKLKYLEDRLAAVGMTMVPYNERFFLRTGKTSIGTFATLDEMIAYVDGYEFGLSKGKITRVEARGEEDY